MIGVRNERPISLGVQVEHRRLLGVKAVGVDGQRRQQRGQQNGAMHDELMDMEKGTNVWSLK